MREKAPTRRQTETKRGIEWTILVVLLPFLWKYLDYPYLVLIIVGAGLVAYILIIRMLWKHLKPHFGAFWALVACTVMGMVIVVLLRSPVRGKIDAPPTSDLRIEKTELIPFKVGETPKMNIWIMNDSVHNIEIRSAFETATTSGFPNDEARRSTETSLWVNLRGMFDAVQLKSATDEGFTQPSLPPKVESTLTLNVETMPTNQVLGNRILNAEQVSDLQANNGKTAVIFIFIFAYRDVGVWHELESCSLTTGGPVVRCSIGHNGPAKGVLNHWWD